MLHSSPTQQVAYLLSDSRREWRSNREPILARKMAGGVPGKAHASPAYSASSTADGH